MPKDLLLMKLVSDLIIDRGGKGVDLAEKLGISSQRLGHYKNKRREPGIDFAAKWKEVFNEDIVDLYMKMKQMFQPDKKEPISYEKKYIECLEENKELNKDIAILRKEKEESKKNVSTLTD